LTALLVVLGVGLPATASAQSRKAPPGKAGGRGPVISNPTPLERFRRMPPEQRRRVLEQLAPERQKQFEERFETYDRLGPEERERLREQYQIFRQLPPERQEVFRRLYRKYSELPDDRRAVVGDEFHHLSALPEADRRARINSDEFRNKYTLSEQQLLQDLTKTVPSPTVQGKEPE